MKKFLIGAAMAASFLTISSIASAACNSAGCNSTIKEVYVTGLSHGEVRIRMDGVSNNSGANCTMAEGKYMTLLASHPLFDKTYREISLARLTVESVFIRTVAGSGNCRISYVKIGL